MKSYDKVSIIDQSNHVYRIVIILLITLFVENINAGVSGKDPFVIPKLFLKDDKGLAALKSDQGSKLFYRIETPIAFIPNKKLVRSFYVNNNLDVLTRNSNTSVNDSDKHFKYWESEKRFGTALLELGVTQLFPWALAEFIMKPGWSKVGFNTWWYNFSHGWDYDGDSFLTNNFTHPYHGNFYFNTARTNGYNFWESVPFSFAGSLMWEYFGEYYRPSFNDWLNTSVSGFNLGEMAYRVTNLITDNTARGSQRVWQEIFAGILNPIRGFNRLISGEAWKVHPNTELYIQPVKIYVDGGMRRIVERGSDITDSASVEGLLGARLNYGDVLESDLKTPFSNFSVWLHASNGNSFLTELHSIGYLAGWKLGGNRFHKEVFSINVSYDFLINPAFEFGAPSITFNFTLKNMLDDKTYVRSDLGLVAIIMGSTSTEYFYGYDGRDYDFGPGPGIRINSRVTDGNWNYISLSYTGAMIFTMSGTPESSHYLHDAMIEGQLPVNEYFAIGLAFEYYWRNSFYKLNEDVSRGSPIGRVFFITKL
jgi:hypothetical protein